MLFNHFKIESIHNPYPFKVWAAQMETTGDRLRFGRVWRHPIHLNVGLCAEHKTNLIWRVNILCEEIMKQ